MSIPNGRSCSSQTFVDFVSRITIQHCQKRDCELWLSLKSYFCIPRPKEVKLLIVRAWRQMRSKGEKMKGSKYLKVLRMVGWIEGYFS